MGPSFNQVLLTLGIELAAAFVAGVLFVPVVTAGAWLVGSLCDGIGQRLRGLR